MEKNKRIALEYLQISKELISELEKMIGKIEKHKRNCNIAKTVGTVATVLGTGVTVTGIALATFATAGAALIIVPPIMGWVGFGASAVGSATTSGTQIVDSIISSGMRKKIEDLQKELRSKLEKGPAFLGNIDRLDIAKTSITGTVFKGAKFVFSNANQAWANISQIKKAKEYTGMGGFLAATCGQSATPQKIICTYATKNPLLHVSVLSLIATGVELYFLYKTWTEPHALEKVVQDLIKKLQANNERLQSFIDTHGSDSDLPDLSRQDYEFQVGHY